LVRRQGPVIGRVPTDHRPAVQRPEGSASQAPHIPAPGARRLAALRARPDVAVAIDTETEPPQALLIRGKAQISEVDGVDPDYAISARQYLGKEAARELLDMVDQPGTRMARITVRPAWVGLLDFAGGRLPGVMATP
jgi:hypothetical protein